MAVSLITQAMTSNTAPAPYVASASSNYYGYDPFKAFDKAGGSSNTSSWSTNALGPPAWLRIDLGTAKTATSYSLTPISNGSGLYLNRSPSTWTVEGSNDGTTWSTVDSRSGITWPTETDQSFTVATPGSYRYYRLNVTANAGGGTWVAVGEWDLLGDTTPSGTLGGTLPKLTGSFAATHTPPAPEGTLSGTLPALTGSFQAETPVAGSLVGTLSPLEGSFAATSRATVETSTQYANLGGYNYHGEGEVDYDPPVTPSPARIKPTPIQRVHQSLPVPTLVNGRPV